MERNFIYKFRPSARQAGCGAVFGVVPFVSRRALGVVCGVVGAGGNFGGMILQVCP